MAASVGDHFGLIGRYVHSAVRRQRQGSLRARADDHLGQDISIWGHSGRLRPFATKIVPLSARAEVPRIGPSMAGLHFVVPNESSAYSFASAPAKKIVPPAEITGIARLPSSAIPELTKNALGGGYPPLFCERLRPLGGDIAR